MSIIGSRLNNDFYKLTMPYVAWLYFQDLQVRYEFTNRNTDFPIARYVNIDELRDEIEAWRELRLRKREQDYIRALGIYTGDRVDEFLRDFFMTALPEIMVERVGDQLKIWTEGPWWRAMDAETPVLSIVTELVSRNLAQEAGLGPADIRRNGHRHLDEVIATLKAYPDLQFAQFGARRRYSNAWEYEATARLAYEVPEQMVGISNIEYAREFGFNLSGTIAHEYFMVVAARHIALGTPDPLVVAQNECLDMWEETYQEVWDGRILCAIPDTFGTDFYLANLTAERAALWRVYKQDSGDPKLFVDKVLTRNQAFGIEPGAVRINHTDGLNLPAMLQLREFSQGRYQRGFGWGTKLTNNVGVATHSLVWKPSHVLVSGVWVPCVKLSDNVAKATGDKTMVETVKHHAGYHNTYRKLQNV